MGKAVKEIENNFDRQFILKGSVTIAYVISYYLTLDFQQFDWLDKAGFSAHNNGIVAKLRLYGYTIASTS